MKTLLMCVALALMSVAASAAVRIRADVWADNWFAFYLGEKLIREDPVPITTERSFNSESFEFTGEYPLQLNFVARDFIENDTGLEYIGTRRQQIGDGGFVAQFFDAGTGALIAVTNADWKCLSVHRAPLDVKCAAERDPLVGKAPCLAETAAEPVGWKRAGFDDAKWPTAFEFSAGEVGPKGGYDSVIWSPKARFIWAEDLKRDNTILCRLTVRNP